LRHQLEHVVPTVIHDPEEKMTALARFTTHAVKEPRRYLGWPAAILGGIFLAVVVWKLATGGRSTDADAWAKLETAKTAEERVDLAKEYPRSPVATWAQLQAATEYYNLALSDLPHNRDVARPTASKALDLFEQVEREAPKGSPQARAAALGKARTLEMRNDLSQALEQYEHVIKQWPDSPEAADAKRYAEALKDPQAAAFYKDLYAFSPTKMTLPPLGTETLPSSLSGPSGSGTSPASGSPTKSSPFGPLKPESPLGPPTPVTGSGLPADLIPRSVPDGRGPTQSQTTTPKEKSEPAKPATSQKDLPAEVFSPKPGTAKEKAPR
jgi:hypothetical protein